MLNESAVESRGVLVLFVLQCAILEPAGGIYRKEV
jgi:hypothetical protein